jgi:glycosyltransferase involved in cell wall biosynthesis
VATPALSILLPVRDAASTLDEALSSIRAQTFRDWELIAIDDGSKDASPDVLRRHVREDPRILFMTSEPAGLVSALETARAAARAPLLARMDADDVSEPGRLAAQVALLARHPEIALCGTHVRYFPRSRVGGGARRYEAWLNGQRTGVDLQRDLWIECPLAHPTFAMRAAAIDAVGGYRDMAWPEDYDLVLRIREAGYGLGVVPQVLLRWREGRGRLSRRDGRYGPDGFRRVKLHFLRRSLLREKEGLMIWGAGPTGKAFARSAIEAGIPVRAFVELDPRKIGQEIHGAPVVSPDGASAYHDALAVAAVAGPVAREEIRSALAHAGWLEGRDFVAVA